LPNRTNRIATRVTTAALAAFALALVFPASSAAQFTGFGKNKIQYEDFQWEVLNGEHIDLYYYEEEKELALLALDYGEQAFDELVQKFSYSPKDRIPMVIFASHHHFEQTNIVPHFLPEGVAGFTEFLKGRVALPFNGSLADFRHVIKHELVHVFQARKGAHLKRLHPGGHVWISPFWFVEGLAEYWSTDWNAEGDLVVRDMLLNGRVPDIPTLDRFSGSFVVYKMGQLLLEFLGERYGEEKLVELLESEWKYRNFSTAFHKVYGAKSSEVSVEWHEWMRQRYFPSLAAERPVATTATPVVTSGRFNFTPAVLPGDGGDREARVCFLSMRSGFTTIYTADLFGTNADLEDEVVGGRSGEFESFHPLQSLVDVSTDGLLAFVAKAGSRDALFIRDLEEGERVARKEWDDLVALSSPTWAPDGRRVAFVGLSRSGYSDLYVWDRTTDRLDRVTNDRYFEATPSWSPNSDEIVFSSDRTPFGKNGSRNLFLIDIATRKIEPLTFGRWVDRDPDWSPDGTHVVFSSDRAGSLDLYVVDREGNGYRATSFAAGAMHPRWYRENGQEGIVFSAYEDLSYGIYRVDLPEDPPTTFALAVDESIEGWRYEDEIPEPGTFTEGEYSMQFGLDFANAALALSEDGDRGEGATVVFSDLMGDHILIAQVNSQSGRRNVFSGFTGVGSYFNVKRRLNWGITGYRLRSFFSSILGPGFDRRGFDRPGIAPRDDFFEERWGVSGIASYPISKFQRVEGKLTFERNNLVNVGDATGNFSSDPFFRDAWLTIGTVGWVYDNSLWNAAGPIDGQRLNVSMSNIFNVTSGGIESTDLLVDLRKYFRTSLQTTYAVRFRSRVSWGDIPTFYFLGGSRSLRGYPHFILNGSSTVLLNQEWRFPLIAPNPMRTGMASLLANGIWGAPFVDLGNAWMRNGVFRDDDGELDQIGYWPGLLGSYGMSFRYPLGGPFILRLDVAKRFQVAEKRDLFPGEENDTHINFFVGYNY